MMAGQACTVRLSLQCDDQTNIAICNISQGIALRTW